MDGSLHTFHGDLTDYVDREHSYNGMKIRLNPYAMRKIAIFLMPLPLLFELFMIIKAKISFATNRNIFRHFT